ncbi:MAG: hypothetical protein IK079_02605, partial [Desulfovibrio sp.]|nr:hypothetical protein [Desulfovibrio sp.]
MDISCPNCSFTRPLSPKIGQKKRVIATCPKCNCRFYFLPQDGSTIICNEKESNSPRPDDPLPEGAVVVPSITIEKEEAIEEKKSNMDAVHHRQTGGNPWERAPGRIGWFSSFFLTCLRVMFSAQRFFSQLTPSARLLSPLFFYLLISSLQFLISYGWMEVIHHFVDGTNDAQLNTLLQYFSPQGNIFSMLLVQVGMSIFTIYLNTTIFFLVFRFL